jgi:hypothetical protein
LAVAVGVRQCTLRRQIRRVTARFDELLPLAGWAQAMKALRVRSATMNLEPRKTETEIQNLSGTARAFVSLAVVVLAAIGILVVLEVIPMAAFGEVAAKTSIIIGIVAVSVAAITLLTRR